MDRMTVLFWCVMSLLIGSSVFYGVSAEKQRHTQSANASPLISGDLVKLEKLIDGDSLLVSKADQTGLPIRLLGIKAFDAKIEKAVYSSVARAGLKHLESLTSGKLLRVQLNTQAEKDKHDRYLATLYAEDEDVALNLIREGWVLVYTVYPFGAMQLYLHEQTLAKQAKRGLWADPQTQAYAQSLIRSWRNQTE
ncbi:hypothetical protein COW36_07495 [bacterium (Candidatus Blackallbacteria) CG17_big_fil_post_rev_8_21_14_2_50_48_46]|uniref:TNase-like domain-containing protein n=1 Tax=bacterium (Candidatus Blackallbacteria) CG17_big_fil_post_rev_8_21_14_2_50_48_46 TaxID=2014261 RepID=A0A2M7G6V0_9BACT|nr:MAG: hypothetical protein COW64_16595 [bacterium (Candidatus Blackallbacteria) CG18_big_fil_WC_8_21_14_2_50_49_26]PIW17780.1 MAG: hypothetical protein COW36_07495 [bacterium (Candidatus Blackallbacteria) CG17_big_fil_post_rev_8_21_14_2_50_48_46]PIW47339.1 MAG: hypothetical protein COW20_13020 [bacterium (Candidatus Blackallbacteria) CG13_big_fil_rev_8_21_14_2_50_49_14]